jgi:hypothetical protein
MVRQPNTILLINDYLAKSRWPDWPDWPETVPIFRSGQNKLAGLAGK